MLQLATAAGAPLALPQEPPHWHRRILTVALCPMLQTTGVRSAHPQLGQGKEI